ncbi:uncharacterized protein LOC112599804 [Melanaphis sacchari]|uniref:uncharacterized protein LOC112599804 n=1 Tax=Melanaphis sacchari TaxID=742174 RepID=UPI000DC12DE2|nr:uncharacterized protein LOC112599804 [Melanaphis sacchari]
MSMQFLKDIETPRNTSGTFSNDDDDDDIEVGRSYEHKSDSNGDTEDEEDIDKETTHSFEGMDSLVPQNDAQIQLTRNNSPIAELNSSKSAKTSGQKKNEKKRRMK